MSFLDSDPCSSAMLAMLSSRIELYIDGICMSDAKPAGFSSALVYSILFTTAAPWPAANPKLVISDACSS